MRAHSNPPLSHERRGAETSSTEVDIFPSRSVVHLKQWRRTGGLFRGRSVSANIAAFSAARLRRRPVPCLKLMRSTGPDKAPAGMQDCIYREGAE